MPISLHVNPAGPNPSQVGRIKPVGTKPSLHVHLKDPGRFWHRYSFPLFSHADLIESVWHSSFESWRYFNKNNNNYYHSFWCIKYKGYEIFFSYVKFSSQTLLYPDIEMDYLLFVRNQNYSHIDMNLECFGIQHLRRIFDHFHHIRLYLSSHFLYHL